MVLRKNATALHGLPRDPVLICDRRERKEKRMPAVVREAAPKMRELPRDASAGREMPGVRLALNLLLVGLVCHLSTEVGFAHRLPPHNISSLWPTSAILFSVLVATPTRHWWAYVLAGYVPSVTRDVLAGFPSWALFFIVAGIIEIVYAAVAVRRFAGGLRAFNSLRGLLVYIGAAVVLAPFTAAFVAAASAPENFWFSWRVWFLSEAVAFVMLAPAILTWMDSARAALAGVSVARCAEASLIAGALVTVCALVFSSPTQGGGSTPALVYLPLPLLLWLAVRFGPVGVNTALLTVASLSISGAVHGYGPFTGPTANDSVLSLQLFLVTMAIPLMFLATLIEERSARDRAMRILSGRLVTAQEEERKHIARELHDEIGQILTVVKINLEFLSEPARQHGAAAGIEACVQNVDRAIEQARALAHDLRPSILDDLGLPAALRWFVDQIPERRLKTHLAVDACNGTLSPEVNTAAFRVAQEAVTNVLRHARAGNVWVSLASGPSNVELSVRDDGRGFDVMRLRRAPAASFGLSSMEERVRLVGGLIEIRTSPGAGTEVWARFPTASA
jgi:signal transduction histidine kinase